MRTLKKKLKTGTYQGVIRIVYRTRLWVSLFINEGEICGFFKKTDFEKSKITLATSTIFKYRLGYNPKTRAPVVTLLPVKLRKITSKQFERIRQEVLAEVPEEVFAGV
jgi:hypothetical protein